MDVILEVKRRAKWDAKVVEKMDAILDANMVLTGIPFTKQKWKLSRKQFWKLFRKQKIDTILDVIKDVI